MCASVLRRPAVVGGITAALFAVGVGLGIAAPGDLGPPAETVTIEDFAFAPARLTVEHGAKVEWVNHDDEAHSVVLADPAMPLKSGGLDTGESFAAVFDRPGTYAYFCSIHPQMTGTVIVR
jgi:plastocyanin